MELTFFPLSIHIDDFGVKNPPLFPPGYVVKVRRIDAELSLGALLRRQVVVKQLVLEDPGLNLTSGPDGPWNFENPQAKLSENPLPLGVFSRVQIKRGQLIASNLLPSDAAGPIFFEAYDISGELEQVNLDGIINPSSSSEDGQGSLKAGVLRFGSMEVKNLESKLRLEARHAFFTDVKAEVYGGSAAGDLSFYFFGRKPTFKTNCALTGINLTPLLPPRPPPAPKSPQTLETHLKFT